LLVGFAFHPNITLITTASPPEFSNEDAKTRKFVGRIGGLLSAGKAISSCLKAWWPRENLIFVAGAHDLVYAVWHSNSTTLTERAGLQPASGEKATGAASNSRVHVLTYGDLYCTG
jgi:hypothetical protein